MATMHPDAQEFLRYFPPGVLVTKSRCPLCGAWAFVDLLGGHLICYRHEVPQTFTLRERIDAKAQQTMEQEPNGATVYRKPRKTR